MYTSIHLYIYTGVYIECIGIGIYLFIYIYRYRYISIYICILRWIIDYLFEGIGQHKIKLRCRKKNNFRLKINLNEY